MDFLPRALSAAEGKEASSAPSGSLRGSSLGGPPPAPTARVPPARVPAVQQSCRLFFKLRFNKCWKEDTQANDCPPACSLFLNCVIFQFIFKS